MRYVTPLANVHTCTHTSCEPPACAQGACVNIPIVAHSRILPSQFVELLSQIQKGNMEFFMAVGMGLYSHIPAPRNTDFVVVISGDKCTPCKTIMPLMEAVKALTRQPQISAAWSGQVCTVSLASIPI